MTEFLSCRSIINPNVVTRERKEVMSTHFMKVIGIIVLGVVLSVSGLVMAADALQSK